MAADTSPASKRKEIYNYQAPWVIFSMSWSQRVEETNRFRLAIGSFIEEYTNKIRIVQKNLDSQQLESVCEFSHPYPATKIMWAPNQATDLDRIATTGDYLRIWKVNQDDKVEDAPVLLNSNSKSEYCAPLTSFDWNTADPNVIGTSSIDTTCTIWDLEKQVATTQLIAHDKEVYDIAFSAEKNIFASVGADGSVRLFDLRSLEHSTIVYESENHPLLRLAWNKQDPNFIATILTDSPRTVILDVRMPSLPYAELGAHTASVNAIAWAPNSSCHICTCSDDKSALIWDIAAAPRPITDPILAYNAEDHINQLQWSAAHPLWVTIAFNRKLQILRV